jgi:hypothetical protein
MRRIFCKKWLDRARFVVSGICRPSSRELCRADHAKIFTENILVPLAMERTIHSQGAKIVFGRNLLSGPGRSGLVALTQKVEGIMTFACCNKSKETHHIKLATVVDFQRKSPCERSGRLL